MSSIIPVISIINAPSIIAFISGLAGCKYQKPAAVPIKIPSPPILGLGPLCILRLLSGLSTILNLKDSFIIKGVTSNAVPQEIRNAISNSLMFHISVHLLSSLIYSYLF